MTTVYQPHCDKTVTKTVRLKKFYQFALFLINFRSSQPITQGKLIRLFMSGRMINAGIQYGESKGFHDHGQSLFQENNEKLFDSQKRKTPKSEI